MIASACRSCGSTIPHRNHMVLRKLRLPMRVTREQVTVFLSNGTLIGRTQPGAVAALKIAVRTYLAKVPA